MPLWEILLDTLIALLAVVIVACFWLPPLRRRLPRAPRLDGGTRPDGAVRVALGTLAILAVLYSVTRRLRIHLTDASFLVDYHWWSYTDLLLGAGLSLLGLTIVIALLRRTPAAPVAPSRPRTWRSFLGAGQLWLLLIPTALLLALVLFAGSISSPDTDGVHRMLRLDTSEGGGGGMDVSFFGWGYGLPAGGTALAVVLLTLLLLHVNAVRPFLGPERVRAEEASRTTLSTVFILFAAGVVLVTLARAAWLVSRAGEITLRSEGYQWQTSVAAISPWLFWASLGAQLLGYVLLLLAARIALRRPLELPTTASEVRLGDHRELGVHGGAHG